MKLRRCAGLTDAELQEFVLDHADDFMRALALGGARQRANAVVAIHLVGWDVDAFYAAVGRRILEAPDGQ